MNEPIKLVTTKSDAELAEELKKELQEAIEPLLKIATKALSSGFHVQMNMAPNAFNQVVLQQLNLIKTF